MELEANNILSESVEKLSAVAGLLEKTVAYLEQREASMTGDVQKIVAAVEYGTEPTRRELERAAHSSSPSMSIRRPSPPGIQLPA